MLNARNHRLLMVSYNITIPEKCEAIMHLSMVQWGGGGGGVSGKGGGFGLTLFSEWPEGGDF